VLAASRQDPAEHVLAGAFMLRDLPVSVVPGEMTRRRADVQLVIALVLQPTGGIRPNRPGSRLRRS
jgi:hypothetical protein